jgi:uncharacterized protein (DUF1501 family)
MPTPSDAWFTCDGNGAGGTTPYRPSRRNLIRDGVAAALAAWLGNTAFQDAAFANPGDERDILVVLFLRGGADGLSLVSPYGEDAYYSQRPTLALKKKDTTVLDDFFGLHPALGGLEPLYKEGELAVVHAVGSGDDSRSHFEAMSTMERGIVNQQGTAASGWLARHLLESPIKKPSPLRAVAFDYILPDMLRGAIDVSVLQSLADFKLHVPEGAQGSRVAATLASLYQKGEDPVVRAGRETLAVLDAMKRINPADYKPLNGAAYPETPLGQGLKQVACLSRANVGLEVAALSRGGWDTHVAQGGTVGLLAGELKDVGDSLAAFAKDLGKNDRKRVTVVVMTEFGRRVHENDGLGTDHGRASVMFAFGGGINGGKVYGQWPGLKQEQLEEPGDLRVTTDYRRVLAEIVARRLGGSAWASDIFAGITPKDYLGITRPV